MAILYNIDDDSRTVATVDGEVITEGELNHLLQSQYGPSILDALITNFHLPKSTLIMLVSALAGRENVLAAYEDAVKEKYRFFSFGDAMFIK